MGFFNRIYNNELPDEEIVKKTYYYLDAVINYIEENGLEGTSPPDPPSEFSWSDFIWCFEIFVNTMVQQAQGRYNQFSESVNNLVNSFPKFKKRKFITLEEWTYAAALYGNILELFDFDDDIDEHNWRFT